MVMNERSRLPNGRKLANMLANESANGRGENS